MSDIKTSFHHDSATNKDIISRVQDVEPIIKEVAELKKFTDGRGETSMGYFAGRIPAIVIEQYLKEVGITFHEFCADNTHVHRILNNPDYKKFRIFEGKV